MTTPLRCVIDANICIKYFIPDPLSNTVDRLLDHLSKPETQMFIPDLFYAETANVLWKYVRAGQYQPYQVETALITLQAFPFQVTPTKDLVIEAAKISINYEISVYDSCYVALSQQVLAPLLTLDQKLLNALKASPYNLCRLTDFPL